MFFEGNAEDLCRARALSSRRGASPAPFPNYLSQRVLSPVVLFFLVIPLALAFASAAGAHPMGNFSVNRWTKLVPRAGGVDVSYLVDFAEVPTQTELSAVKLMKEPEGTAAQDFARDLAARLLPNLVIEARGTRVPLRLTSSSLEFVPGLAGLPTMRLKLELKADLPRADGETTLRYSDGNFAGRVGWKEVIAVAGPGAALLKSNVPATDQSRGLTDYPTDPAEPPSETTTAELTVRFTGRSVRGGLTVGF